MNDIELPTNKISVNNEGNEGIKENHPIKQCHFLQNKWFIVIDESITKQLKFYDAGYKELYFQQEVTEADCIILRPFKMSE